MPPDAQLVPDTETDMLAPSAGKVSKMLRIQQVFFLAYCIFFPRVLQFFLVCCSFLFVHCRFSLVCWSRPRRRTCSHPTRAKSQRCFASSSFFSLVYRHSRFVFCTHGRFIQNRVRRRGGCLHLPTRPPYTWPLSLFAYHKGGCGGGSQDLHASPTPDRFLCSQSAKAGVAVAP